MLRRINCYAQYKARSSILFLFCHRMLLKKESNGSPLRHKEPNRVQSHRMLITLFLVLSDLYIQTDQCWYTQFTTIRVTRHVIQSVICRLCIYGSGIVVWYVRAYNPLKVGGYTHPPTSTRLPRYSATLYDIITRDLIDIIYQHLSFLLPFSYLLFNQPFL